MLVLARRVSEVIDIGDDISIVVVKIDGEQVKIGIEAPKDLAVRRRRHLKEKRD